MKKKYIVKGEVKEKNDVHVDDNNEHDFDRGDLLEEIDITLIKIVEKGDKKNE